MIDQAIIDNLIKIFSPLGNTGINKFLELFGKLIDGLSTGTAQLEDLNWQCLSQEEREFMDHLLDEFIPIVNTASTLPIHRRNEIIKQAKLGIHGK